MRKRLVAGAGVLVALALAGCSSSAAPSSSTTTTTSAGIAPSVSTTAPPNIQSLVLSINDLPSGWSVDNTAHTTSTSCYSDPLTKVASTSYTHADFAQGGSLPSLVEELGTFASAPSAFAKIASTLNACKSFSETSDTDTIKGAMGPMSSPTYGDQSAAWTATLTVQGFDANQGFVMVRKGSYLMIVALGDIGSLDSPTLQGFVAQALAKIPG